MNKFIFLVQFFFFSLSFANDAGSIFLGSQYLEVKVDQVEVAPKAGTRIEFTGEAARNFFNRMPPSISAMRDQVRSFTVVTYGWNLFFNCVRDLKSSKRDAMCEIFLSRPAEVEGDVYSFDKINFVVPNEIKDLSTLEAGLIDVRSESAKGIFLVEPNTKITFSNYRTSEFLRLLPESRKLIVQEAPRLGSAYVQQIEFSCNNPQLVEDTSCSIEYTHVNK